MSRERGRIEAALLRKGFRKREGDHHFFIYWGLDGKKTPVFTKTSHGAKGAAIGADLFGRMARQLRLKSRQFEDLVDCPMTREQYEQTLREQDAL